MTGRCPFNNLLEPQNARRGEAVTVEVMKRVKMAETEISSSDRIHGMDRRKLLTSFQVSGLAR